MVSGADNVSELRGRAFMFLGLLLAFALARFIGLGWASFWIDELTALLWIRTEINPLTHAPFYYLLKAWVGIFGQSESALRVLPVLLSLCGVGATYALAARLLDRKAARYAALIHLMMPYDLYLGRQLREYPLLILVSALMYYAYIRFRETDRGTWMVGCMLLAVLAMWTHLLALFAVVAVAMHYFLHASPRRKVIVVVLLTILALLVYTYMTTSLFRLHVGSNPGHLLERMTNLHFLLSRDYWIMFVACFVELISGPVRLHHVIPGTLVQMIALLLAVAVLAYASIHLASNIRDPSWRQAAAFLATGIMVPPVLGGFVENSLGVWPLTARYISSTIPLLAIALAWAVVNTGHVVIRRTFASLLLATMLAANASYAWMQYQGGQERIRQLVTAVSGVVRPGDVIYSSYGYNSHYERVLMPEHPLLFGRTPVMERFSRYFPSPEEQSRVLQSCTGSLWIIGDRREDADSTLERRLAAGGFVARETLAVPNWSAWNSPPTLPAIRYVRVPKFGGVSPGGLAE